jgi:hypothetical protein
VPLPWLLEPKKGRTTSCSATFSKEQFYLETSITATQVMSMSFGIGCDLFFAHAGLQMDQKPHGITWFVKGAARCTT